MAKYQLPDGVTTGEKVINVVNCKLTNNSYGYGVGCPSDSTSENQAHAVLRYMNFGSMGACFCDRGLAGDYITVTADSVRYGSVRYAFAYVYRNTGGTYGDNVTFLQNDKSTTSGGTSSYSTGYAPIPTSNVITVGTGKDYETLDAAYAAASHGDNIVIDAGTYSIDGFQTQFGAYMKKCVRFYGATEDPDDVNLTSNAALTTGGFLAFAPLCMDNVPVQYRGPGFFHVTISYTNAAQNHYCCGVTLLDESDTNPWNYSDEPSNALMFSCNT